jgi:hypothetical protein
MARIWVLDTETKGTGAEMVPLEKALRGDAARSERISVVRRRGRQRRRQAPEPRPPAPKFRVVDVVTREVLADGADTRTTVDVLRRVRRLVDVLIQVWDESAGRWELITHRDRAALWKLR